MNRSIDMFENTSCHDLVPMWQTIEREDIHPQQRRQQQQNNQRLTHAKPMFWTDSKRDSTYPLSSSQRRVVDKPYTKCSDINQEAHDDKKNPYETIPQLLWFHESDSSLDLSSSEDDELCVETHHRAPTCTTRGPLETPMTLPEGRRRHVRFDPRMRLREYSITIGDHPGCEDALPLTLDWAFIETSAPLHCEEDCGSGVASEQRCSTGTSMWSQWDENTPKDGSLIQIRPLTMAERRHRLIHVGAYTAEEVDAYLQEYYSGGYIFSVILELFTRCLPDRLFLGSSQTIQ